MICHPLGSQQALVGKLRNSFTQVQAIHFLPQYRLQMGEFQTLVRGERR
ncbi:hypothetical protein YPPY89_2004 [Yersinia pestis PY-89]|nr:hypothetical protein YPPY89_2004 [Yersinia pestis PY-89]